MVENGYDHKDEDPILKDYLNLLKKTNQEELDKAIVKPVWCWTEEQYRQCFSLWVAGAQGDDGAVYALIDFYSDHPPPPAWIREQHKIVERINYFRRKHDIPLFKDF